MPVDPVDGIVELLELFHIWNQYRGDGTSKNWNSFAEAQVGSIGHILYHLFIHLVRCTNLQFYSRLSHLGTGQAGNSANTTALSDQLGNASLAELLDDAGVESNLKSVGGGEAGLEGLPDLLLGVEDTLGLSVEALEEDALTSLGIRRGGHELDRAIVVVLTLLGDGGGG